MQWLKRLTVVKSLLIVLVCLRTLNEQTAARPTTGQIGCFKAKRQMTAFQRVGLWGKLNLGGGASKCIFYIAYLCVICLSYFLGLFHLQDVWD